MWNSNENTIQFLLKFISKCCAHAITAIVALAMAALAMTIVAVAVVALRYVVIVAMHMVF